MFRSLSVVLTAGLVLGLAEPAAASGPRELNFDVFLDDRAIGYQRFELAPTANGLRVETRAEFEVRFLMVTAFEYDHRNVEHWRGGCLHAIDAQTDSNGKQYTVNGSTRGDALVVASAGGEQERLTDCVATFAYWDKDVVLQRDRLLNSQTGEYLPVEVEPLGAGSVRIGEREVPVRRYALKGKDLDITLAYTADSGEWVALDSRLEGGRTLRYRRNPVELVESAGVTVAGRDSRGAAVR